MASLKTFFFVSAICVAATVAISVADVSIIPGPVTGSGNGTDEPTTFPTPITSTTTKPTTTKTTTTKPTTTTTGTTSTTATTGTTSTTATTATTRTTQTTTTSTSPTTTAGTTTTTPAPTPVDPKTGTWVANYTSTNQTCIVLQAALQFDIPYMIANTTKEFAVNVPVEAEASGNCTGKQQMITLSWGTDDSKSVVNFAFVKTNDSKFDLADIEAVLNVSLPGQGPRVVLLSHKVAEFAAPLDRSYKCIREQKLNLTTTEKPDDVAAVLHVSHVQLQAFRNTTGTNFADALDCMGSETPDVVPIAVGCALAALVIIVLIAYLIGRRRSQARGYLSMFTQNKREEDYIPMKNLSCFS